MDKCSNCYSNCGGNTQSDKCVKYTGVDIEFLGISNGDNLNFVTGAITNFLATVLNGTGIIVDINPASLCTIITDNLSDVDNITVLDITRALSIAICSLDSRTTTLENFNNTLNGNYTTDCVPGVDGTEGVRVVLQAVINHLCTVTTDLEAVELDLSTNYVAIEDIDTYIANYITNNPSSTTGQRAKMVPFTAVEYYGPLNVFDSTGAGIGDWEQIYLCNGENGAPDKRGRIGVGTTTGMGGGSLPSETNPGIAGNPNYSLYTTFGTNTVTLTEAELPSHTHTPTLSTVPDHTHTFVNPLVSSTAGTGVDKLTNKDNVPYSLQSETEPAGGHTHTISIANTGSGEAHNNVPPVLACHYIIYIPTT
jgi:microcystin-dependent protein